MLIFAAMKRLKSLFLPAVLLALAFISVVPSEAGVPRGRMRDFGLAPGVMKPGALNAITDVAGVRVGHVTKIEGEDVRTGVTAILPHTGNLFRLKVPAAVYVGNGFGKLAGSTQVAELGCIEAPILLTNTLNVAEAVAGGIEYTLTYPGNEGVGSVNVLVGETNDGVLNDIRGRHVTGEDVLLAINSAHDGPVEEGNVGAGTGTVAFGLKGGIGTASRVLPAALGGFTVGALVQTNYGGTLEIDGIMAGKILGNYPFHGTIGADADGSCMIVVATDAPVDARNLERMAKRAVLGLAKTGGIAANGSGDYAIAFSVCPENLIDASAGPYRPVLLQNDAMTPLFMATIEAVEEALWNSLFAAETMTGRGGRTVKALDPATLGLTYAPQGAVLASDLRVRDPFIIVADGKYHLIANMDREDGTRCLQAYESPDLEHWFPKGQVSEVPEGYLGTQDWWAPDTYFHNGKYYVFVTLSNSGAGILRGTTIFRSDDGVDGPYRPVLTGDRLNITPEGYQCLDGSLYVDPKGIPWMVYCVEWNGPNVQDRVGEVWTVRLKDDFTGIAGKPRRLFKASEAAWVAEDFVGKVTDAPFIITDPATGRLIMTWSSFSPTGGARYCIGQAYSDNGLFGPWKHSDKVIFSEDGGHAMVFRDLEGRLRMSFHCPNSRTETLTIKQVEIRDGLLEIVD